MTALQASLGAPRSWDPVAPGAVLHLHGRGAASRTRRTSRTHRACRAGFGQARAAGLGVGLWRLGDEDQETWNIPSLTLVKRVADMLAGLCWRSLLGGYFLLLAGIVWFIKSSYLPALWLDPVFGLYSLCVTVYLLSRFSLSLLYRPVQPRAGRAAGGRRRDPGDERAGGDRDDARLDLRARLPAAPALGVRGRRRLDRRDVGAHGVRRAALPEPARHPLLAQPRQARRDGRRHPRRPTRSIVCFVDSDSTLEPDALREIIKPFRYRRVARP